MGVEGGASRKTASARILAMSMKLARTFGSFFVWHLFMRILIAAPRSFSGNISIGYFSTIRPRHPARFFGIILDCKKE